ncbi:MBL fold metallo-hydrolase [Amycolatopsis sp. NPDC059021]|uniref:MBL fold metallo-hydrolase n=1 Tax=Amycolatopsis sp. NPDC059021 TaxID=3346704 RepID=UPI00366A84FB
MSTELPEVHLAPEPIVRGEPVEVADGVFVIPDNRVPLVPNVGIVAGTRAALVVDTGLGPRNGKYVLEQARRLAGDKPLYLTTTHFHPEHGFGAQAFKGAATIVANRAQRDELRRKGAGYLGMFSGFGPAIAAELEHVELTEPDLVYDGDRMEIDLGGHVVALHSWGPAHSAGDQVVSVDDRVLFAGDLAETRMFPLAPWFPPHDTDADPGAWLAVLDRMLALEPAVVVPGHGEVTDTSVITETRDYLAHIRDEVGRLRAGGTTDDEVVAAIDGAARARWNTWDNPEWIAFTTRAFLDGENVGGAA